MLLEWFNAREAIEVGAKLADQFLPEYRSSGQGRQNAGPARDWRKDLQTFRQRVTRETSQLKLNFFKRAKLLNSFKWKLLERGFDSAAADDLTHEVLMHLCVPRAASVVAGRDGAAAPARGQSLKRIPALLAEADARFADGKYTQVVNLLQEALALDGRNTDARANLGIVLCHLGRYGDAEQAFRRALEIKASCRTANLALGTLLRAKGDFAASETVLRRAVKHDPRNPQALASLGLTLGMRNRLSEAGNCLQSALRLRPHDPAVLCSLGWLAGIEGRFEEAEKHYRATLEADPKHPGALALLVGLRRMTDADTDWLAGVERTLANGVPPFEESKLRYAMGKYFDDLGKYSKAFEEYKQGNELRKLLAVPYSHAERTEFVDEMIGLYTRQRLAQSAKGASESARPVLVTGMMRSGTSLVEQIIASHPQVTGAGELDFWNTSAHKQRQRLRSEGPDEQLTRKLGESYLRELERHSSTALRVVDKSTFNTDHLGLIHLVLPRARVVYVQRDPVDNCLSCYFQDFANMASFTMDLSDLAHYYREHHRLIAHWRSALPEGALLVVPYAELVADPETWSRRIIEFIGLEWDSRCLEFHKTQRSVLTASNWQVRQRVYSSSVGRYRNYQKFIGPLLELRDLAS